LNTEFRFGSYVLDLARTELRRGVAVQSLRPKTIDVLKYLVENAGRLASKEEILRVVWPNVVVSDDSLVQCITELRQVFGADGHTLIRTVPKRGYVFEGVVQRASKEAAATSSGADKIGAEAPLAAAPAHMGMAPAVSRRLLVPIVSSIGLVLVLTVVVLWFTLRGQGSGFSLGTESPSIPLRSLAVLPFTSIGDHGGEVETLGLGMADALILRLSAEQQISVAPTTAIVKYSGVAATSAAVARELSVDAILEGSVQRVGGRVRVTSRLLRGTDGTTLWADQFEEEFKGIFLVQDSIAEKTASSLLATIGVHNIAKVARRETNQPEAYEAYLKGKHFLARRTDDSLQRAIQHFSSAITLDPEFANAHAALAEAYDLLGAYASIPPRDAFRSALSEAKKAITLDPGLAAAHTAMAFAKAHYDHDWLAAEMGYRRAIALAPGYSTAEQWYALALTARGNVRQALEECRRALKTDPVSLIINTDLGRHHYYAGQFEDAARQLRETIDLDPSFMRAHYELGRVYKVRQMYDLALAELDRAVGLSNRSPIALAEYGAVLALTGQRVKAQAILDEMYERRKTSYVSPYHVAVLLMALGDREGAINSLMAAYEERFNWIVFVNVEPNFRVLKSHPKFRDLVARLGVLK
jgi:DNA-binding winged helix-turn-helix (wHTH) protein/TolB-like protein